MDKDPGLKKKVTATVIEVNGTCGAGHQVGDTFDISVVNTGGMCGLCYHRIFPALSTFQLGGNFPWWQGENGIVECPDKKNKVVIKLEKTVL